MRHARDVDKITVHPSAPAGDARPVRMSPSDAVLWRIEQDPILRSTITAIGILDRAPDWDGVRAKVLRATELLPRLRQRVVDPAVPGDVPRWLDDAAFDLDYHLRRVRVPDPGSRRDLLDLAVPVSMQPFDPRRPLWEFTVVEGLEGGQAALIQKLHHSITDGEGAVALALALLDPERRPRPASTPAADRSPGSSAPGSPGARFRAPSGAERLVDGVARVAGLSASALDAAQRTATDPIGSFRQAASFARSMAKAVEPVPRSASPILGSRGLTRRLETIDLPLAQLREAAHLAAGTVNDAFLAGVVGGLTRYHERRGSPVESLRITMPISVRSSRDALSGNRFVPVRFEVPCTISDPGERIRVLGGIARSWQQEPFVQHSDLIATVLAHLPGPLTSNLMGSMLKHVDAVATNVAGLPDPTYLAGAELLREYAFAPPTGAGLNVALLSHVDTACIGIVTDTAAVPDDALLVPCFVEAFGEILALTVPDAERTR
jgi:WS/DGAT/MGAT family acyltransferase